MCKIFDYAYLRATSLVAECAKYLAMLISVPLLADHSDLDHFWNPLILTFNSLVDPRKSNTQEDWGVDQQVPGVMQTYFQLVVQDISLLVQLSTKASLIY